MAEDPKPNMNELGLTGLHWTEGGSVTEEILTQLQGKQGAKIFAEMRDNDPVIGSILFAIDMAIRQVEWFVAPNPEAKVSKSKKDTEFLESAMHDMSHTWEDLVSEIMTMIPFGFSLHELCYKRREGPDGDHHSDYDDGNIGWRKLPTRSQDSIDRWEFDEKGGIRAVVQKPPPNYEDIRIPIEKLLLFRTTTIKGNPEGRSALRNAYRPWWMKKRMEEIEAIGVERDLAGLPVAFVDSAILREDASEEEKAVLTSIKRIVANIKRDTQDGVVWPKQTDANGHDMYDLKLLTGGGSRTFDTSSIIDRYDRRITMTVLADFIMLGQQNTGSFALASSKTNLFAQAIGAWLKVIEGVFNQFAVPRLFKINGMDASLLPEIRHGDIESPELSELGAYLSQMAGVGMPLFPNEKLEDHLLDAAGLPKPTDEERDEQEAGTDGQAPLGPEDPMAPPGAPGQEPPPPGEEEMGANGQEPQRVSAGGLMSALDRMN